MENLKDAENKKALVDNMIKDGITNTRHIAEEYVDKIYGKCIVCFCNRDNFCRNLKSKFLNQQVTAYESCEQFECFNFEKR